MNKVLFKDKLAENHSLSHLLYEKLGDKNLFYSNKNKRRVHLSDWNLHDCKVLRHWYTKKIFQMQRSIKCIDPSTIWHLYGSFKQHSTVNLTLEFHIAICISIFVSETNVIISFIKTESQFVMASFKKSRIRKKPQRCGDASIDLPLQSEKSIPFAEKRSYSEGQKSALSESDMNSVVSLFIMGFEGWFRKNITIPNRFSL